MSVRSTTEEVEIRVWTRVAWAEETLKRMRESGECERGERVENVKEESVRERRGESRGESGGVECEGEKERKSRLR